MQIYPSEKETHLSSALYKVYSIWKTLWLAV